jgi:hypothetical protein
MQKVSEEDRFKKLIYMASPHANIDPLVREDRYNRAMRALSQLLQEGHLVFSPIVHTHEMAKMYAWPNTFDYYRELDLAWLDRADEIWVLMLDGWDKSKGVTAEITRMAELGKPIWMLEWSDKEGIVSIREFAELYPLAIETLTDPTRDKNSGKQQPFEYDPT